MLLNESTWKEEELKMPLRGVGGARECGAGQWNTPRSRSLMRRWDFLDVPLNRKKSTGGLFLLATLALTEDNQVDEEVLPLVVFSADADVDDAGFLVSERIFLGRPTGEREEEQSR